MVNETYPRRHPDLEPTHPGAILRDEVLPALGISVVAAARQLGITRQTLHRVLAEKGAVTPEMALRVGKFCGNGPTLWLRLQEAYDLWHTERKLRDTIAAIQTMRAA